MPGCGRRVWPRRGPRAARCPLSTRQPSQLSRTRLPHPTACGQSSEQTAADTFARAVEHGDEHVIKFADTAVELFARTGDPDAIAAALRAAELIEP